MATLSKPQRMPLNAKQTYSIAHSAQCKLYIAANQPDRNLRFILGHAFTLDKVLLRIVEIENSSAKDELDTAQPDTQPANSDIQASAGVGRGSSATGGESGSLARPQRRISFSNQTRPSEITNSSPGPGRARSPPPKKRIPQGYEDDDSTSSDDYDDDPADFARAVNPPSSIRPPAGAQSESDDEKAVDDYENDDDTSLGLQRFGSASAAPPRKPTSPPPPMSESDSEDDEDPPKSPPSFPDDVVRGVMVDENEDNDMHTIYETIRGCPCGDDHGVAPQSKGMWQIKGEALGEGMEGKRYGVVKV